MNILEENIQNYGIYSNIVTNRSVIVNTSDINSNNWQWHFDSLYNLMRDGIETDIVQNSFVTVVFPDGMDIELSIPDYYFNLILWRLKAFIGDSITEKDLFFEDAITVKGIKNYIDDLFIGPNRLRLSNIAINNMIDDCVCNFAKIEEFNLYLSNTINLEDTITLMNKYPEFNSLIHSDMSNVPLDEVKTQGLEATNKVISYIKNSNHCLAPFFKSGEGINTKQFKEAFINIGTKPDGQGGVYNAPINSSFVTGGVNDYLSYFIESATGRVAQIIVEGNTGDAGHFARLLGLNNIDTFINPDPNYSCNTKNFIKIVIENKEMLKKYEARYYRMSPDGLEHRISIKDSFLIGKEILLRSPMTCESFAHGHGICYKCYGDLAYTNYDINVGRIASENLSSKLTQRMLSAKHLLETAIKKLKWVADFQLFLDLDYNIITLNSNDFTGCKLLIDPDDIVLEEDYAKGSHEYIPSFIIEDADKVSHNIYTSDADNLYITCDLNDAIRDRAYKRDGVVCLDCDHLIDIPLFMIHLRNNDLSKTLDLVTDYIDNSKIIKACGGDMNLILQRLTKTIMEANLDVMSIHTEVILANQIRNIDDILELPNWDKPNEQYRMLTLKQALGNNPSITVTLAFERLLATLYNPLTYRKHKPSYMDVFFMVKPQDFMVSTENIIKSETKEDTNPNELVTFGNTNK